MSETRSLRQIHAVGQDRIESSLRRYNLIMKSVALSVLLLALGLTAQTVPADPAIGTLNRTLLPLATLAKNPDGDTFFGTALRKGEKCFGCARSPDFQQLMKISRQLVDDITSVADRYHQPTSASVLGFAYALTSVLAGRDLPVDRLSQVTTSIVETLDCAAESAPRGGFGGKKFKDEKPGGEDRFIASVTQAKKALMGLGVGAPSAQIVAEDLAWMGKSVWSPHPMPLDR